MIKSTSNNKVKKVSALQKKARFRKEEGLFVAEGIKMCKEIPKNLLQEVYISEDFYKKNKKEIEDIVGKDFELTDEKIFEYMSDTVTPQGILCVVKNPTYSLDEITNKVRNDKKESHRIVILEDLRDPGNLGTIIRTGEAAGVSAVIMTKESADIFNPKVVRSTMGSIFRVPFVYTDDLENCVKELKNCDFKLYAAGLDGKSFLGESEISKNAAFLIGNEAKGLKEDTYALADEILKIPMEGSVESLNAAVSAAVLIYYHKLAK